MAALLLTPPACSGGGGGGAPTEDGAGGTEDAGAEDIPGPDAFEVTPVGFHAVWAEFLTPAEAEAALPLLRGHGVALNLAWPAASLDAPDYTALARKAEAMQAELRPWLLLAEADGYWPGSTNAVTFAAAARALMDHWDDEGLAPTWLILDMETPWARSLELQQRLQADPLDTQGLLDFLQAGIDRDQYTTATHIYGALVQEAQARGWFVHLTTLPMVLDDFGDGDDTIRQALNIPFDGLPVDLVTFQVYRTLMADFAAALTDQPLTPYVVYAYGQTAVAEVGDHAGLDLGLVGAGITPSSTYTSPADLAVDLLAAAAAGIGRERLVVFNLDGMLTPGPPTDWMVAEPGAPAIPPPDEATAAIRQASALLDGVDN